MSKRPKKNIYQIILCNNGKRIKTLYSVQSERLVNEKFNQYIKEANNVKFPIRYVNIGKLIEAHYELYIIKRNDDDPKFTKLRNENGKNIDFSTDDENWVIYDRENYEKEETFWVYGFHPIHQRKDFVWIMDNLINNGKNDKYNIKQVFVFQNKLLVSTTFGLNIVFCKNVSDCIRLYNDLERECKTNKIKFIIFSGDAYHSTLRKTWYKKMMDLTGFPKRKLNRNSLRP